MLTIHATLSGAFACLAEIRDGVLWSIHGVDLDLVEGVLDDCGGHVGGSLWYEYSIGHPGGVSGCPVPLIQLVTLVVVFCQLHLR